MTLKRGSEESGGAEAQGNSGHPSLLRRQKSFATVMWVARVSALDPRFPTLHPCHSPGTLPASSTIAGCRPRRGRAGELGLRLRTVVGVAGVLVERDDFHALLAVQVIVQLLGAAAETRDATAVPRAATTAAAGALSRPGARGGA